MSEDQPAVRAIAWREVFPWLRLTRVFRLAVRPRVLLIAILAALVCNGGWRAIGWMFRNSENPRLAVVDPVTKERVPGYLARIYTDFPWAPSSAAPVDVPGDIAISGRVSAWDQGFGSAASFASSVMTARPIQQLLGFGEMFKLHTGIAVTAFLLLCLLWAIAVWAIAGGMITRITAVAITRGEQISWSRAVTFAKSKWLAYVASPLLPIAGVLIITLFMALVGLIIQIPYAGVTLGAILWPLMLIGGLLIAILLLGLVASWPLMWCTVSTEGTDSFDALGRSYGYLFGRPLRYLGYAVVALVLGWIGWYVVGLFAELIVQSTLWATSWGATSERVIEVTEIMPERPRGDHSGYEIFFAKIIWFLNYCVMALPLAFIYSYFWTAAEMIYLLLRRDEDQTELDEVWLEEEQEAYGLPPLKVDGAGIPAAVDVPPPAPPPPPPPSARVDDDKPLPL